MIYPNVYPARFRHRPNRFVAQVELEGEETTVHVKNTGRCRELLIPGARVYLTKSDKAHRKTAYDLIAVEKGNLLINMDSQAPNRVFQEWAEKGDFLPNLTGIRPEYTLGDSRFDFCLEQGEQRHLVEIKGVTLEEEGVVRFPDAPTQRGVKHLKGLAKAAAEGYTCWVCFVVQMSPVKRLEPNEITHPAFGEALRECERSGVHVMAVDCTVAPGELRIKGRVPVSLRMGEKPEDLT